MPFKDRRPAIVRGLRYVVQKTLPGNTVNASTAKVIPSPGFAYIAKSTAGSRVYKVANPTPGAVVDIMVDMGTSGKPVSVKPKSTSTVVIKNRASNVIAFSTNYGKGAQHLRLIGLTSTSYAATVVASTR